MLIIASEHKTLCHTTSLSDIGKDTLSSDHYFFVYSIPIISFSPQNLSNFIFIHSVKKHQWGNNRFPFLFKTQHTLPYGSSTPTMGKQFCPILSPWHN